MTGDEYGLEGVCGSGGRGVGEVQRMAWATPPLNQDVKGYNSTGAMGYDDLGEFKDYER